MEKFPIDGFAKDVAASLVTFFLYFEIFPSLKTARDETDRKRESLNVFVVRFNGLRFKWKHGMSFIPRAELREKF